MIPVMEFKAVGKVCPSSRICNVLFGCMPAVQQFLQPLQCFMLMAIVCAVIFMSRPLRQASVSGIRPKTNTDMFSIFAVSPRSLRFTPDSNDTYSVGEFIHVVVDSNPEPSKYVWVNSSTEKTLGHHDSIVLTKPMFESDSLLVIVCNTIPIPKPSEFCLNVKPFLKELGKLLLKPFTDTR